MMKKSNESLRVTQDTSGHRKLFVYFKEISKSDYFRDKIMKLRKKLKVPVNGFPAENGRYYFPPHNWEYAYNQKIAKYLEKEVGALCQRYGLHFMDWSDYIEHCMFYNFDVVETVEQDMCNLCFVTDLVEEKREPFGEDYQKSDDAFFPIAIRVSPYASLRDIIDFVKKSYTLWISPIQEHYRDKRIKIGRVRNKKESIQKRNDFIYENRNLPKKELMRMVNNHFNEVLDYSHIGKIISLETERRKEL